MSKVPTAAYSIGLKIVLDNVPGTLGRFAVAIGDAGGNIAGATGFEAKGPSAYQPAEDRPRKVSAALWAYAAMTTSADKGAVRDITQIQR